MSFETKTFLTLMAERFPVLRPIMAEHLDDNLGEMLPHLLIADITRYLVARYHENSDARVVRDLLGHFEAEMARATRAKVDMRDDNTLNLISVSCVELLPAPSERGHKMRRLLGPTMSRSYDEWFGR